MKHHPKLVRKAQILLQSQQALVRELDSKEIENRQRIKLVNWAKEFRLEDRSRNPKVEWNRLFKEGVGDSNEI